MRGDSTALDHIEVEGLSKVAFPGSMSQYMFPQTGMYGPHPTTSDVLTAINMAQVHDIGTPNQRMDAFGKVINSGLTASSPAVLALKAIGGGVIGNAVTSMFTNKPFLQGLGIGAGAYMGLKS